MICLWLKISITVLTVYNTFIYLLKFYNERGINDFICAPNRIAEPEANAEILLFLHFNNNRMFK